MNAIFYLKLYKLGSIYPIQTTYVPQSFMKMGSRSIGNTSGYSTIFRYALAKKDEKELNDFIRKIKSLSKSDNLLEIVNESKPLGIALRFYDSCLLESKSTEHRIANSISCLEALYLSDPSGELKRRLSQRVALIMKHFGFVPNKVFEDVKDAYDIRSKYVHGNSLNKKQILKAFEIIENIVQYSRISFLVFLQWKNQYDKKKLLKLIDQALLDETISKKLSVKIEEHCLVHL